MALRQVVVEVRVLVEADEDQMSRTLNFVKSSLKGACRNLNNGTVVIGLYDDDGGLLGLDVTGQPSAELQELIENLFGEEEEEPN